MTEASKTHAALISNIGWTGLGTVIGNILRFAIKLVLVRILSPKDFGLLALATFVLSTAGLFQGAGIQSALVNQTSGDRLDEKRLSAWFNTGLFLQAAITSVIAAIVFFLNTQIANYFNSVELIPVLNVLVVCIFIAGLTLVPSAVLTRSHRFKELSIIENLSLILYCVIAVVMAQRDFGVLSVIYAQLFSQVLYVLALFFSCFRAKLWVPSFRIERAALWPLLSFGGLVVANQFLAIGLTQGDNAFVGKIAGSDALGFYSMAYFLGTFIGTTLGGIMIRVAYPVYCQNQSRIAELQKIYLRVFSLSLLVVLPATVILFLFPEKTANIVLSTKWKACIPLIPTFALCGFFRFWNMLACIAIESSGRKGAITAAMVKVGQIAVMAPLLYFGYKKFGLNGAATAVTVSMGIGALFTIVLSHQQFQIRARELLQPFLKPVLLSLVACVGFYFFEDRFIILAFLAAIGVIALASSRELL